MTMEDNKRRRRQQLTRLKATPGAPPAPPWRLLGSRGHPQPRPLLHAALDPVGQPLDPYPMRPPPHVCRSAWSPPPLLAAALVGSHGHPQPRPLLHAALDPVGQPLDPYPMRPPPHVCLVTAASSRRRLGSFG